MIQITIDDEFEDIELSSNISFPLYELNFCSICLNELDNNVIFDCNHSFHLNCIILNMLEGIQRNKCPLCRQEIKITNINNVNNCLLIKLQKFIKKHNDLKNTNNIMQLRYINGDIINSIWINNLKYALCFLFILIILVLIPVKK